MSVKNLVKLEKKIVELNKGNKEKFLPNKAKVTQIGSTNDGAFNFQVTAKIMATTSGKKVTAIRKLFLAFAPPPEKKKKEIEA